MDENEIIEDNNDFLCTDTTIKSSIAADKLFATLKARKTSGKLVVEWLKGGVRRISLSEKTKASDRQRSDIRKILKMS